MAILYRLDGSQSHKKIEMSKVKVFAAILVWFSVILVMLDITVTIYQDYIVKTDEEEIVQEVPNHNHDDRIFQRNCYDSNLIAYRRET